MVQLFSQNLVPNAGFESSSGCPAAEGDFQNMCNSWWMINSVDYFNACGSSGFNSNTANQYGIETPAEGQAYAGLKLYLVDTSTTNNYREFPQVQLSQPLQAGEDYCVSFKISLADKARWAVGEFHVYFTNNVVSLPSNNYYPANITPSLVISSDSVFKTTDGWELIGARYTAQGGEQYMLIGNFYDDENTDNPTEIANGTEPTAYYYIDEVDVHLNDGIATVNISDSDTLTLCSEGSLVLNAGAGYKKYTWQDGSTKQTYQVRSEGMYRVTIEDLCGNKASDQVYVVKKDCQAGCLIFPKAFSPDGDAMNPTFRGLGTCAVENYTLKIFNRWGALIYETNDNSIGWDGTMEGGKNAPVGSYMWITNYKDLENNFEVKNYGGVVLIR